MSDADQAEYLRQAEARNMDPLKSLAARDSMEEVAEYEAAAPCASAFRNLRRRRSDARPINHWKRAEPRGFPRLRSWMTLEQWFREVDWFLETITMRNERDSTAPRGRKGGGDESE